MLMEEELTRRIIGAAMEVHRVLGPGLLESAYEEALCRELSIQNLPFQRQVPQPLTYKGVKFDCGYRLDLVVDGKIVVEIKSVDDLAPIHGLNYKDDPADVAKWLDQLGDPFTRTGADRSGRGAAAHHRADRRPQPAARVGGRRRAGPRRCAGAGMRWGSDPSGERRLRGRSRGCRPRGPLRRPAGGPR